MQGYKVLVVEQDAALRLGLRHSLERLGYSVVESGTGAAALTHAEADGPSLILLNLALPDGDGLEVAEALRRGPRTSGIPIILLTAERVVGQRAERMAKISAGTIPISKPVMVDRLEMTSGSSSRWFEAAFPGASGGISWRSRPCAGAATRSIAPAS